LTSFCDIYPYDDLRTRKALRRASWDPRILFISKYLFPDKPLNYLSRDLRNVSGVDEFQMSVMTEVVKSILDKTSDGLEIRGLENLNLCSGKSLFISNHRDIVMDPAILLYALSFRGFIQTDLCVGSNLLSSRLVEDIMRSNRLVKVYRGLPPHEMSEFSHTLSAYIRQRITSGDGSVWIAQRQGRAKDSIDRTSQGILKMLSMSGSGDFKSDFARLGILPVSVSYQYESCDALKARELFLSRNAEYKKKKGEDTNSILTGIKQKKGKVCISFCEPLSDEVISEAASRRGNERYKALCEAIDSKILGSYKLWNTNYMGNDLMNGVLSHCGTEYSMDELVEFKAYAESQICTLESGLDKKELLGIFYSIYGNPVSSIL